MTLTVNTTPSISSTSQTYSLSTMFSYTPDSSNPTYLYVTATDLNAYTTASTGATGTFAGNGNTLGLSVASTPDLREAGIVFIYDTTTGQYSNATYGSIANLTYTTSTSPTDVTDINFFATNSAFHPQSLANNDFALILNAEYNYMGPNLYRGSVSLLTSTVTAQPVDASSNATQSKIAAAAQSLVGQAWDSDGCYQLANTISAMAGATLPLTAIAVGPGLGNGEWFTAYQGETASNTDWQQTLQVGDMVVFKTNGGTGHVTTVVSGAGHYCGLIDNASFGWNTIGGTDDLIIQGAHASNQEFDGTDYRLVTIYRLDAPITTAASSSVTLNGTNKLTLSSQFSAIDPRGTALTRYEITTSNADTVVVAATGETLAPDASGAYSVASLAGVTLAEQHAGGTDTVAVRAYNGSYWGDWTSITVNQNASWTHTAPDAPILTSTLSRSTNPAFTGFAAAGSTVTLSTVINGVLTSIGTAVAGSNGAWSLTSNTALAEGSHIVTASDTDSMGYASPVSSSYTMTVDLTPPTAPTLAPRNGATLTRIATTTLQGVAEAGSLVTILDGLSALGTTTANASGLWSFTRTLGNGAHLLTATASDAAGNVSAASSPYSLTVDTIAPTAPGALQLAGLSNGRLTQNATIFSGTAEANSSVSILDGNTLLGTTTADASGAWSRALTLADGSHSLRALATDLAGNVSVASAAVSVLVGSAATAPASAPTLTLATIPVPSSDPAPAADTPTTYRFFDKIHGTQFLTTSSTERDNLIATRPDLTFEGNGMGTVAADPSDSNVAAVFRFFNTSDGTHFFTVSSGERDAIVATRTDMIFEGASFNEHLTAEAGDTPVYRFFNGSNGSHFFTSSAGESATLAATRPDMVNEGIAFYAPLG